MSDCQRMENDLVAYLDGKSSIATRHKLEAHLAECAGCRKRAAEFRAVSGVLDEWPAVAPSSSFDARLRARIAAEPRERAWWRTIVPSPRMAFATAALLAMSIWILTIRQPGPAAEGPVEVAAVTMAPQGSDADFRMIQNLPELENYDLLNSFDALSDLPTQAAAARPGGQAPARAQ